MTGRDNQDEIEGVGKLVGVVPEFMEKALNELDGTYGSPENYVIEELGITKTEIQQLKEKYLVK